MIVFITGANRGIGLYQTKYFLADGDTVIATYRNEAEAAELFALQKEHEDRCHIVQGDITVDADVEGFKTFAEGIVPAIDILVNNAGIDIEQANPRIEEVGIDLLEHVFSVNTLGTVRVCKALLPLIRKSTEPTRGLIANTTSGLASMSNPIMMTRYGYMMSKVSINMLSRGMAFEFGENGPTVVAWSPGWVQTRLGTPNATYTLDEGGRGNVTTLKSITANQSGKVIDMSGEEWSF